MTTASSLLQQSERCKDVFKGYSKYIFNKKDNKQGGYNNQFMLQD
jgi:hypothetical protein